MQENRGVLASRGARANPGPPANLVFVMSDDHAAHAIGAYGSQINQTPNLDRLAVEGMRFDNCFCTNSICTPSRAAILCGTYNHINGVTTLDTPLNSQLTTFPKLLQAHGYATAIFGKWHLGDDPQHQPTGFDAWEVLPGQGDYHDPHFLTPQGVVQRKGYATDIITDLSIDWLRALSENSNNTQNSSNLENHNKPFALLCHHKAPHRPWEPDAAHAQMYEDETIPEPQTFWDDYVTRTAAAHVARCRMMDLNEADLKAPVPVGLTQEEEISWRYQRYIKDYLRVVASIDDNVGRLLDALDELGLAENTMVVYTSDQGFFLGEHGWFDKRFMYEQSLNMPLLVRWPRRIEAGSVCANMVTNVDFAPTFLEAAQLDAPDWMQGHSLVPLLEGGSHPAQQSMYYRYWMHHDKDHYIKAHLGVRTLTHKLICFYNDPLDQPGAHGQPESPEWELYDLEADPFEINNIYGSTGTETLTRTLQEELFRLMREVDDTPPPCLKHLA